MKRYRPESYGEGFADVYDDWYRGISDVDATVAFLERAAGGRGRLRVLELAVGTGRISVPLARRGHDVTGIDVSPDMLERLRAADTDGLVTVVQGDMAADLPCGPFDLAFVAYNSIFMLTEPERQAACFAAVAGALAPAGRFVVEAFVPYDPPRPGDEIALRSMTANRVVLSITSTDAATQRVDGQFVDLVHGEPVRLRPYSLRYSTPAELDAFAAAAGLHLVERFADAASSRFDAESSHHVSVYELLDAP